MAHGMLEKELLAYISHHVASTDIFCFQETNSAIRDTLSDLLSDEFSGHHAVKQNDDTIYFVSTYIRHDIEQLSVETPLHEIPGAGIALSTTVHQEGRVVIVSNVHGAPYPGHKLDTPERLAQSHGLLQFTETHLGTHVFIGDFNLLPETESVQVFSKQGFDDLIQRFHVPTTRNSVAWDKYPDNKQLYADYAFVRSDTAIEYDFIVDDTIVSDHLPLRLILRLNEIDVQKAAVDTSIKIVRQV
ncbi:MAG: endonuclease/exonuclease/phosphatase family protein [Candidatus Microsaccharimonas sp.]